MPAEPDSLVGHFKWSEIAPGRAIDAKPTTYDFIQIQEHAAARIVDSLPDVNLWCVLLLLLADVIQHAPDGKEYLMIELIGAAYRVQSVSWIHVCVQLAEMFDPAI